jgi:hypothetical protein
MSTSPRYIGLDIHRQFVMIAAVDEQQQVLFDGMRVSVLAELHIRSEICAIVTCSGHFACSVTFRHNLPHDGKARRCPCDWSNVQQLR